MVDRCSTGEEKWTFHAKKPVSNKEPEYPVELPEKHQSYIQNTYRIVLFLEAEQDRILDEMAGVLVAVSGAQRGITGQFFQGPQAQWRSKSDLNRQTQGQGLRAPQRSQGGAGGLGPTPEGGGGWWLTLFEKVLEDVAVSYHWIRYR